MWIQQAIIMAGGSSSRLSPCRINKQLLPVYDKPMIYYPLSTLMLAGICKFHIVSSAAGCDDLREHLGYGERFGVKINYVTQDRPNGIAEGILLCEDLLHEAPFAMILGDNIFHGHGLIDQVRQSMMRVFANCHPRADGVIFAKQVADPQRYGVVYFDEKDKPSSIVEKPDNPTSNWAAVGLYLYSGRAVEMAKQLEPSGRGELEITDLNSRILAESHLSCEKIGRGIAWLDTGTPASLLQASEYVAAIQERQDEIIACPEEIGIRRGWVPKHRFSNLYDTARYPKGNRYGDYVRKQAGLGS